tara:strand:- start:3906 stop:5489 length:1584 start_codon:yes stop_codon:yes gene_type:complete
MENNKIKFVNLSGNAILKNMSNNPDDLYPPTHIFPYTDPGPEAAHNEYKNFDYEIETGNGFKKYKLDWQNSYMIDQWQVQHRMHENDGVFKMFLKHDVDIEMIEEPSVISNIENYIDAQEETIIIIFHRLYAYSLPYSFWRKCHDKGIKVAIDNSFEAETYSLHKLMFWLHSCFKDTSFVKLLTSQFDNKLPKSYKTIKQQIKQHFGIDLVEVDFFILHEQNNKISTASPNSGPLEYETFEPDKIYVKNKPKKFLCMNNYMKEHRFFLLNYLINNFDDNGVRLIDRCIASARFSLQPDKPFYNHGIDATNWEHLNEQSHLILGVGLDKNEFDVTNDHLPIIIDDDLLDNKHAVNPDLFSNDNSSQFEFRDRWVNWRWYAETDLSLVTESSYTANLVLQKGIFHQYIPKEDGYPYYDQVPQEIGFITEKTFKPIMYGHPFLLVTHPGTLRHLRSIGFETFPEWIDESYDEIEIDAERFKAIKREVIKLANATLHIEEIKDKLEHNRKLFFSAETCARIYDKLIEDILN